MKLLHECPHAVHTTQIMRAPCERKAFLYASKLGCKTQCHKSGSTLTPSPRLMRSSRILLNRGHKVHDLHLAHNHVPIPPLLGIGRRRGHAAAGHFCVGRLGAL